MIEFTRTDELPQGLDRLWTVLTDPAYVKAKYRAIDAEDCLLLAFDATPAQLTVQLQRVVEVDPASLPRWSRGFVGARQTLEHRSCWTRTGPAEAAARLQVMPLGQPVQAEGEGRAIQTAPARVRLSLHWCVRSPLPLIGPRIERLFAAQLQDALEADHRFTDAYLRRHAGG